MKHKILTSIDNALKSLGESAKDAHELSISAETNRDQWGAIHDQTMATITMMIGIRNVASDVLSRKSCK